MAINDYNAWYSPISWGQSVAVDNLSALTTAASTATLAGAAQSQMNAILSSPLDERLGMYLEQKGQNGSKTLETIKGAIHSIKDEVVSDEAKASVESKVDKYERAGLKKQAQILKNELKARIKLARIKEWEYKVLPAKALQMYNGRVFGGYTYYVHIDPIDKYVGIPEGATVDGEFDKIVPEHVVDSLLEAQKRQVFDEFSVLWVEKVKDPLLLGKIKELPDYFLIDEWGDDVKFSDIIKASKKK